jgi:hypothetical protein
LAAACGARSELDLAEQAGSGGEPERDAGMDAPIDAPIDAPMDARDDVFVPPECSGPEVTYIYVVTDQAELFAYKPQSNAFELKGTLDCPSASSPFSMAVSRDAVAHVLYQDGELFQVSIEDASCEPTPYIPPPMDAPFNRFGMGYAANPDDDGETLYVADITFSAPSQGLATLDTDQYLVTPIGPFSINPGNAIELTPTGLDGPLFGYFLNEPPPGGTLVEIDTQNANIVSAVTLGAGDGASSLAVAWWGGFFYIFTGPPGQPTTITRYDPTSGMTSAVTTLPSHVVGAGVSTCAPNALP